VSLALIPRLPEMVAPALLVTVTVPLAVIPWPPAMLPELVTVPLWIKMPLLVPVIVPEVRLTVMPV
jgi:hypothetical protein